MQQSSRFLRPAVWTVPAFAIALAAALWLPGHARAFLIGSPIEIPGDTSEGILFESDPSAIDSPDETAIFDLSLQGGGEPTGGLELSSEEEDEGSSLTLSPQPADDGGFELRLCSGDCDEPTDPDPDADSEPTPSYTVLSTAIQPTQPAVVIPEPGTAALLGAGLVFLYLAGGRSRLL